MAMSLEEKETPAVNKNTVYSIYGLQARVSSEGKSIEVEAEFNHPFMLDHKDFRTTNDGSLLHNGIEFISRNPMGTEKLLKSLKELFESEGFKEEYIESPRTSTHIHVNVQNRTKEELFTILVTYYLVEDILFKYTNESRSDNLFCLPLYAAEHTSQCLRDLWDEKGDQVRARFNIYKYAALSIANVARLGTIEFRHLEGTRNLPKIAGWLDLIDRIYSSYKIFANMGEAYSEYQRSPVDFVRKVFGDRADAMLSVRAEERSEINMTKVFEIVDYPNVPKKEVVSYQFKSSKQADDLKFDAYLNGPLYKTTPMEL